MAIHGINLRFSPYQASGGAFFGQCTTNSALFAFLSPPRTSASAHVTTSRTTIINDASALHIGQSSARLGPNTPVHTQQTKGANDLNEQAVHLSFDRAVYTEDTNGPCQILARSFYSPGLGYCVEVDSPGYCVPVPKNAVKAAMERGVYVWVSQIQPVQLDAGSAINLMIKFKLHPAGYIPLICNEQELKEVVGNQPYYPLLRQNGTKSYRFNPRIGHGSNIRPQRSEAL